MKISILILALLTIISSKAQDIRDTLQGEYIGIRKHYGPGVNGLEYTEKDTIYVYKATLPNKIHIRYLRYTTEQEYLIMKPVTLKIFIF